MFDNFICCFETRLRVAVRSVAAHLILRLATPIFNPNRVVLLGRALLGRRVSMPVKPVLEGHGGLHVLRILLLLIVQADVIGQVLDHFQHAI